MPPSEPSDSDPVLLLATSDVDFLPVVRSLLDSAGIPYAVQGEHALGQLPTGPLAGPFARSGMAARVLVPRDHAEAARELLAAVDAGSDEPEEE
jgi:hypothetical protein